MKEISSSATKIVLLILILTLCAGVFIYNDSFIKTFDYVIVAVVSFYFGQKSNQQPIPKDEDKLSAE